MNGIDRLGNESASSLTARLALPVLVRQAQAGQAITYQALGEELGRHPRAFNHALGAIAEALAALRQQWGEPIPHLTSIVVTGHSGRPGPGFGWAAAELADYARLPAWEQTAVANLAREACHHYDKWPAVLAALGLRPAGAAASPALLAAAPARGGEGEAHRRLKAFVAAHPEVVGLPRAAAPGREEYPLPSADTIDVVFDTGLEVVAVEVKAANAAEGDILRGLFQCVKYDALLRAEVAVAGRSPRPAVRAVLVLEARLPAGLIAARNTLGVGVVEGVVPV